MFIFKSKTINIEAEEDPPIIIADVLPAGTTETIATARTYGYADATPRSIGETQYTTTETGRTQYITADTSRAQYITADTDRTQHTTTDADTLQPIHIKLETRGNFITSDLGSSQLRTTQLGSSQLRTTQLRSTQVTNEPVHIHTGQVGSISNCSDHTRGGPGLCVLTHEKIISFLDKCVPYRSHFPLEDYSFAVFPSF